MANQNLQLRITNPSKVLAPVFHRLNKAQTRFVINYGGTASGKSFGAAQKEVLKSCEKQHITLVIRKVGSTLRDSVIPSFRRRIGEFKLQQYFQYNKTDRELTNTVTQSKILFRGLDDPEKMKSFEGLTRIMVEEASELEIEDFMEINRRIRGVKNIQITLNFNPVHEEHWLKKHFFDQEVPNTTLIHSTYKDNPFLTDEDREQIEHMRLYNYNQYRVYALGEWGLTENGNPWLHAFDKTKHVREDIPLKPEHPIYLSFDFNNDPVACTAWQFSQHFGHPDAWITCHKEFVGEYKIEELCSRIRAAYPHSILHITGDRSGRNRDLGRNETLYDIIARLLQVTPRLVNTPTYNLEHSDSRMLCNTIFNSYPNVSISSVCKTLIDDCEKARIDEQTNKGSKLLKDRGMYKMDAFDSMRYFFQTYFHEKIVNKYPIFARSKHYKDEREATSD